MPLPTKLHLQIASAERSLVNEQVDEVEIPGAAGYFGVLPGHTPMLVVLAGGELWYRIGSEKPGFSPHPCPAGPGSFERRSRDIQDRMIPRPRCHPVLSGASRLVSAYGQDGFG